MDEFQDEMFQMFKDCFPKLLGKRSADFGAVWKRGYDRYKKSVVVQLPDFQLMNPHKVQCKLCQDWVKKSYSSKKYHVKTRHVTGHKMFCPYCDFGADAIELVIKRHIQKRHPGNCFLPFLPNNGR